ncbi:DNA-binding protein [Streptomyces nigra]|uniref:DNA-binding protein n=1 Tax=Streptomyces nigra TaxID=1827580 RepID=UPI003639BE1C
MTSPAPITRLTPAERRVAEHLLRGLTAREIAAAAQLSLNTTHSYLGSMPGRFHCPPRCPLPVLVHALLNSGEVTPPTPDKPAPSLSQAEHQLLGAIAEQGKPLDIALAAGIAPADFHSARDELLDKTGAADATQLIVLAHAWNLLGRSQSTIAATRAGR